MSFMAEEENDNLLMFREWLQITLCRCGSKIIDFTERAAKLGRENQKNFLRFGMNLIRESVLILSGAGNLVHLPQAELEFISKFSGAINLAKAEAIVSSSKKRITILSVTLILKFYF